MKEFDDVRSVKGKPNSLLHISISCPFGLYKINKLLGLTLGYASRFPKSLNPIPVRTTIKRKFDASPEPKVINLIVSRMQWASVMKDFKLSSVIILDWQIYQ